MFKLRDYQENQVQFLEDNLSNNEIIALQSATGSGKSIIMIEFIRNYFRHNKNKTVVISTGSNQLVFEFANKARNYGLDPTVIIGNNLLTCYDKEDNGFIYSLDKNKLCSSHKQKILDKKTNKYVLCSKCKACYSYGKQMHFTKLLNKLKLPENKLIITNHAAYLTHYLEYRYYFPDLVLIDEAHMFRQYYDNFMSTSLTKENINFISSYLKEKYTNRGKVFDVYMKRHRLLPHDFVSFIYQAIKYDKELKLDYFYKENILKNLSILDKDYDKINQQTGQVDNIYEWEDDISDEGDSFVKKTKLYSKFNLENKYIKYIIISATVDRLTRILFGMDPNSTQFFYKEKDLNLVDYTKSEFIIYNTRDFYSKIDEFIQLCSENNYTSGMILSTQMEIVRKLIKRVEINGYKLFVDKYAFMNYKEKKILIGSRALFQGVDIPEVQFVALNKIPFETYNEAFIRRMDYLVKNLGINGWTDITLPLVQNALIQSTGRLWRGPSDFGSVCIMDNRIIGRFKYLLKTSVLDVRPGINIYVAGEEAELENTEGFDNIVEEVITEK